MNQRFCVTHKQEIESDMDNTELYMSDIYLKAE